MEKDPIIQKMAKLLQNGATMLNIECPKCNKILFKLKDENIFCPNCNSIIKIAKNNEIPLSENNNLYNKESLVGTNLSFSEMELILSNLNTKLLNKLKHIEDLSLMNQILANIQLTFDLIIKIRSFR